MTTLIPKFSLKNGGSTPTGAINRAINLKLAETVSVLDFDADSTGVTDSSTAFTNAIATGKAVLIPKGTYKINLSIVTGNVTLIGDGVGQTVLSPYTTGAVITINGDTNGALANINISNLSIDGVNKTGHGISVINTADTHGCDYLNFFNLNVSNCLNGLNVTGRSIWNKLYNCNFGSNKTGISVISAYATNEWNLVGCTTNNNDIHGLYLKSTETNVGAAINWSFTNFNSEFNGADVTQAVSYGVYLENTINFVFNGLYLENNGASLASQNSYGIRFTGSVCRGFNLNGVWAVSSKYLIYVDAIGSSGVIDNVGYTSPLYGTSAITISSQWNNGAKVQIGSAINGDISAPYDVNGISPITQGTDFIGGGSGLTSLNLQFRKNITIDTRAGNTTLNTISGLISGDKITIMNLAFSTSNTITLATGLMINGANTIAANTAKSYLLLGYPYGGLVEI